MVDDARWLAGLEDRARQALPPAVFEYLSQGARDGDTAARAAQAWRDLEFRPRVLRDVTRVDPGVDVLGTRLGVPFGIAPTTLQRAVHPEGELAMARAVAAADGLLVVSSNAGTSFADIGATGVRWWVQCYLPADRSTALPVLAGAVEAGARAVVLTVDTPVVGTKYAADEPVWDVIDHAWLRANFPVGHDELPDTHKALDLGPADVAWLSAQTGLPVVVKGVLRPDDAVDCVAAGAAGVWVSNHGGRQLDRSVATATVLPEVVDAVAGAAEVYVDGGLRTGLDVAAALALGASAVFLGRSALYALVEGEAGVAPFARRDALPDRRRDAPPGRSHVPRHARTGDAERPRKPLTCTNVNVVRVTSTRFVQIADRS